MNTDHNAKHSNPELAIRRLLSVVEYIADEAERIADITGKPRPKISRATSIRYPTNPLNELSRREHEVLMVFLSTGSIAETSRKMFISVHTVRTHVRALRQKYEVESSTALVCKAVGTFGDEGTP